VDLNEISYCGITQWVPVVEPDFGQERFFIEDPNETFRNGNFPRVPVIVGMTADEFVKPVEGNLK